MLQMIVCDWNGTLFRDRLEETFFFGLCRRAFWRAALRGRVGKVGRLIGRGVRCYLAYRAARKDPQRTLEHIARIVGLLNPVVFAGLGREELDAYARAYTRKIQPLLDRRLLDPLARIAATTEIPVGVISAGCRRGIEVALAEAGLRPDFVIANEFRFDGEVTAGFDFSVGENKRELLADLLSRRGIDPADVMYVGDSPQDEPCFDLVGLPVVSFFADPADRARLARKHGAFAPTDQAAFEAHVRQAAAPA